MAEATYKVVVVNPDGISVISSSTYTNSATPVFVTAAGSLGTAVKNTAVSGDTFVITAGDADSTTISYSETTSVLATANLELEEFDAGDFRKVRIISSSSTVLPDSVTTYTFTIRATDPAGSTADREFSIGAIANTNPSFTTSSGSLGTIVDSSRDSYSLSTAAATDAEGDTLTYSITSGSLPAGLSLNTSTAAITGTADAVGSDTTSNFTITCADDQGGSSSRAFSITVLAPATQSYTSGSGTWPAPFTGNIKLLVVAAGGGQSSTNGHAGGGGGGGVVQMDYPVTSGTSYSYAVGAADGGSPYNGFDSTFGTGSGTDTTFITGVGGGNGSTGDGGSGGGAGTCSGATQPRPAGTGNTPPVTPPQGQNGGASPGNAGFCAGAGGGGAGAVGTDISVNRQGAPGGNGVSTQINPAQGSPATNFAGGGGGGGHPSGPATLSTGGTGGGAGGSNGPSPHPAGVANTGGGGGGTGPSSSPQAATAGGSGIVIIRYKFQ